MVLSPKRSCPEAMAFASLSIPGGGKVIKGLRDTDKEVLRLTRVNTDITPQSRIGDIHQNTNGGYLGGGVGSHENWLCFIPCGFPYFALFLPGI